MRLQRLEPRRLLRDDTITFSIDGDNLIGVRNGVTETFSKSNVGNILVRPMHGNDSIDASALPVSGEDPEFHYTFVVEAGPGNNTIIGTPGQDRIAGQDGNDSIIGGVGKDFLDGGEGNDRIFGGGGRDHISGGGWRDWLYGNNDGDIIDGGGGNDHLNGGAGNNVLRGGAGNDTLIALNIVPDSLFGDRGDDTAIADDGELLTGIETT